MRILIAGGGTGGHVIPALAVAAEIRRRSSHNDLLMVGTARGMEARLAPKHGVPLRTIDAGALNRVGFAAAARSLAGLPLACWQSRRILSDFRPHAVFGVGGYASGPVLMMAAAGGVPIVIHEPNAVPGFANRIIGPMVARALVAFPEAGRFFSAQRVRTAGVPVRAAFFDVPARTVRSPFTILVSGGSQGAKRVNQFVGEALPLFMKLGPDAPFIIHQTGDRDLEGVRAAYARHGYSQAEVTAFIEDMPAAFARADMLICRAGAATLAEIAAAGRAALLVPFPFAADNHQLRNARSFERAGAARVLIDSELSAASVFAAVEAMRPRLSEIEAAVRALAQPHAAEIIVSQIEQVALSTA